MATSAGNETGNLVGQGLQELCRSPQATDKSLEAARWTLRLLEGTSTRYEPARRTLAAAFISRALIAFCLNTSTAMASRRCLTGQAAKLTAGDDVSVSGLVPKSLLAAATQTRTPVAGSDQSTIRRVRNLASRDGWYKVTDLHVS